MWIFEKDNLDIKVIKSPKFQNQRNKNTFLDKQIVKRYIEDLEDPENNYLTENHYPDDDTEYLDQLSDPRPGGRLVYSKRLSGDDRFCYIINYPEEIDENTSKVIVEVYSSIGHTRPDGGLYYSPDPFEMKKIRSEIKQWRKRRGLPEL